MSKILQEFWESKLFPTNPKHSYSIRASSSRAWKESFLSMPSQLRKLYSIEGNVSIGRDYFGMAKALREIISLRDLNIKNLCNQHGVLRLGRGFDNLES